MPLNDYTCAACGAQLLDYYIPLGDLGRKENTGRKLPRPSCPNNSDHGEMDIEAGRAANDLLSQPIEFTDDQGGTKTLRTLREVREVERISADHHRQGIGRPFVFRQFSQGAGNMRDNVFGEAPEHMPKKTTKRGVPFDVRRGSGERR